MEIIFLGSGGGRWVALTQRLRTGGFRIHAGVNIHVDPGPGAMVYLNDEKIDPMNTQGVIVTHCHPDHYNDAELLIEAMTQGATKKIGTLGASESVLSGADNIGPAISNYHQSQLKEKRILKPEDEFFMGDIRIKALPTRHSDASGIGLKFYTDHGVITYTSDTEYYDGLLKNYKDSRVIILNVIRPMEDRIPWHLCMNDAIKILKEVNPELAIINHFGMKMLEVRWKEARRVEEETGVKTIAARDGMRLKISKRISAKRQIDLDNFAG